MPFPEPQVSIETESGDPRQIATQAYNDGVARRNAERLGQVPQSPNRALVTVEAAPMTVGEQVRARQQRIRLTSDTPAGYSAQLKAIAVERDALGQRIASLRRQADIAIRAGHVHDVRDLRSRIESETVFLEQMSLLEQDARDGLAIVETSEHARLAALRAQIPAAEKRLLAHLKAVQDFPAHAQAIADMVAGEAEAEAAHRLLQEAALRLPGERAAPGPFPRGKDGRALRLSVVIPGFVSPPTRPPSPNDAYAR